MCDGGVKGKRFSRLRLRIRLRWLLTPQEQAQRE
jgi:hypothetical protein